VDVVVLERSDRVAASWRSRYAALRLNTPGWMSTLPGFRATKRRYGRFPSRDRWIQYLEDYAAHHALDVRFGTEVTRIDRDDGWRIHTSTGVLDAPTVVVATGFDHDAQLPDWPGLDTYTGELVHSSAYVDPVPYEGKDVLVIGPGVTGSEVAHHLVEGGAARVRVSVRRPPHFARRLWFLNVPIQVPGAMLNHLPTRMADWIATTNERVMFGDLSAHGLPRPDIGMATLMRQERQTPAFDDGFVGSVRAGRITVVPAVTGFDGADILLTDGSRTTADAVIAATGYHRGLEPLVGHLGVLDDRGWPVVTGGRTHPDAPGLFFNGFRADLSGQLRLMKFDARSIARAVSRRPTNGR